MGDPSYREEPAVVVRPRKTCSLTLSLDTSAYATGDVLAAPQELTDVMRVPGGIAQLVEVVLLDEDDQGQAIDLVFLDADGSLGNENAAYAPTDAVARTILAVVNVLTSDYADNSNSMIATGPCDAVMKAATGSTSLWVGAVCRSGGPTYTAAGIRLKLTFERS